MIKNVAGQKVGVQMVSAVDGSAFTGAVTVAVTVDAGTQATGSVGSGACTHEGNGYHTYAPSQAETNGDLVAFTFTGTGAVPVTVQVYTRAATPDVNALQVSGSATAADNLETAALAYSATRGLAGTALPAAAAEASGGLPTLSAAQASNGTINANVHRWLTGTPNALQTGRVDSYLGAAVAGAFDAVWSVASRVLTAANNITSTGGTTVPQTGDAYARLGAPVGASVSADVAAVSVLATAIKAITDVLVSPATIATAVWASGTRLLTAGTNIVLAKGTGVTGFNDLSAAQVNTEADTALTDARAGYVQAIWDALTSALTTVGSIGKRLSDNIDAAVSSRLASGSYSAAPTANQNADALLDRTDGVETGLTVRQSLRLTNAMAGGELSGAGTATNTIRDPNDSKNRIVAAVDADGNRTAVTLDVS